LATDASDTTSALAWKISQVRQRPARFGILSMKEATTMMDRSSLPVGAETEFGSVDL